MIVTLSIADTGMGTVLEAKGESAGLLIDFLNANDNGGIYIAPCLGFNDKLGFKMQYHPDERDVYDNILMLKKEI